MVTALWGAMETNGPRFGACSVQPRSANAQCLLMKQEMLEFVFLAPDKWHLQDSGSPESLHSPALGLLMSP